MITIGHKDFNFDMDNYITDRKRIEPEYNVPEKKNIVLEHKEQDMKEEKLQEAPKETKVKKNLFSKVLDFIDGSEEEGEKKEADTPKTLTEDEKELDEYNKAEPKKGGGLFSGIKQFFAGDEEDDDNTETSKEKKTDSVVPHINDDIKDVLKIQNRWLLKLPAPLIKEFKESDDYKLYKETLKKYNLIKDKEN